MKEREYRGAGQAGRKKPLPAPVRPDWKAIGRLMEETGKTYGQLVAEGRI